MRLFLAIDVAGAVRRQAEQVQRELVARHGALAGRGLRWVRATQLHLTLRFLGEVPSPLAERVIEACGARIDLPAFEVAFGDLAWLPHAGSPRVLMLPVVRGLDALRRVKTALDARLPAGVPEEEPRPFTPHLTLARVRDDFRNEMRTLAREAAVPRGPVVTSRVDHAALIESRLSPAGPDYEVRARALLRGIEA